jgi:hypothetical protein
VTALHNHFLYDTPKVMFMHISGMGTQENLAMAVGQVFDSLKATAQTPVPFPLPDFDTSKTQLDTANIAKIVNYTGNLGNGVYKITIGRKATMHGYEMGSAMGINTWAAFVGTEDKAVVDGDFAMLESEVQSVLKSLRKSGIHIVAIHNHMTDESPRFIFLHYWGAGKASDLANGIRSALNVQKL